MEGPLNTDDTDSNPHRSTSFQDSNPGMQTDGNEGNYADISGLKSQKIGSSFVCCPWETFERPGAFALGKWKIWTPNNSNIPDGDALKETLPIKKVDTARLSNPPQDKVQVTWIGHATVYVQFDGISILTDPVFGDSCGPHIAKSLNHLVSYKRYRKAPCKIKDLPALDAVVISHNHYDHLEESAVEEISKHFKEAKWFVTLGQKELLEKCGGQKIQVTELDWWQEKEIEDKKIKFICTPSQHWCQRWAFDKNEVLWCSWVIKGPTKSFYFAGDTGYYEKLFRTIGQKYGPFDLAAIPIGAYEPRWILAFQHVDPCEAVKIHQDIKSQCSIGIHWGTFKTMACEFYAEPPQKIREVIMNNPNLKLKNFFSLCHGQTWCEGEQITDQPFMEAKPTAQPSIRNKLRTFLRRSKETVELGQQVTESKEDSNEQNSPKASP